MITITDYDALVPFLRKLSALQLQHMPQPGALRSDDKRMCAEKHEVVPSASQH